MRAVLDTVGNQGPTVVRTPTDEIQLIATLWPVLGQPDCIRAIDVEALRVAVSC